MSNSSASGVDKEVDRGWVGGGGNGLATNFKKGVAQFVLISKVCCIIKEYFLSLALCGYATWFVLLREGQTR